ncbi:MAG TPA: hypothetical protein VMS96_05210 [Terriglobales bacterium]|nr:hypothetical protein [Terriglobales bacterium]
MNRFVSQAMMVCMLGVGLAWAETPAQPQTAAANPSQVEQREPGCADKNGMSSKEAKKQAKLAKKQEKEARKRARQEAEPQAAPDLVEMGGGG